MGRVKRLLSAHNCRTDRGLVTSGATAGAAGSGLDGAATTASGTRRPDCALVSSATLFEAPAFFVWLALLAGEVAPGFGIPPMAATGAITVSTGGGAVACAGAAGDTCSAIAGAEAADDGFGKGAETVAAGVTGAAGLATR
jgi:hypothetical protein